MVSEKDFEKPDASDSLRQPSVPWSVSQDSQRRQTLDSNLASKEAEATTTLAARLLTPYAGKSEAEIREDARALAQCSDMEDFLPEIEAGAVLAWNSNASEEGLIDVTNDQREALRKENSSSWKERWDQTAMMYCVGGQYFVPCVEQCMAYNLFSAVRSRCGCTGNGPDRGQRSSAVGSTSVPSCSCSDISQLLQPGLPNRERMGERSDQRSSLPVLCLDRMLDFCSA